MYTTRGWEGQFHTGAMWQLIDPIIKCNYPKTGKGAKVSKEQAQAKRRRQTKKKPAKSQMKSHDWLVFHSRVEKTFHSFASLTREIFFNTQREISYLRAAM